MDNIKAILPFFVVLGVILGLLLLGGLVSMAHPPTDGRGNVIAVSVGGVGFDARQVKEKRGCVSGIRMDTNQEFKWCGDYLLVKP